MLRYRLLRGDSPSARRRLASGRSRGSEICDLSGMDGSLRQSCMKQMGWRPSMNKRQSERIKRPLRRVRIISLSLFSLLAHCTTVSAKCKTLYRTKRAQLRKFLHPVLRPFSVVRRGFSGFLVTGLISPQVFLRWLSSLRFSFLESFS